MTVRVIVPIRLRSEANERLHWAEKARRTKEQREVVGWSLKSARRPMAGLLRVRITRLYPSLGRPMDDDNLAGAAKHARDAVAEWLGVDDRDPRVMWSVDQRRGDTWGAEICITPADMPPPSNRGDDDE